MLNIKTILLPTDFSEPSEAAFHLGCSLARDHGSRLVLLHVVTPPTVAYTEGVMLPPTEDIRDEIWAKLDEIAPPEPGIEVERHMVEGEPSAEIMRLANESNADLIVMGTHGRRGLTRWVMGSVAEAVVRKAPCPVLTVKVPLTHMNEEKAAEHLAGAL
jgi:nucleotide-binding universal stress UspA family protein